jgi:ABC-type Fe3+/spermidine/putrescine transport system ATPase subunit
MTMGTRIVVMKDGFIQQIDSPVDLYYKPINKFVAGFIGTPQMNFFNVKVAKFNDKVDIKFSENEKVTVSYDDVSKVNYEYFFNDKEWRRILDSSYMILLDTPSEKLKHPKVKISGRNDKAVSEAIRNLFLNQELIKK